MKSKIIFSSWKKFIQDTVFFKNYSSVVIVSSKNIHFYAEEIFSFLKKLISTHLIYIDDREEKKTRKTQEEIEEKLFSLNIGKDSAVLALGGGIVLDIAGCTSATYLRGLDLYFLPTTLLAMVDASIGGKCSLNTDFGKNLIGYFYFPKVVCIDFSFLKTLSQKESKNGFFEMAKIFLLKDKLSFINSVKRPFLIDKKLIKKAILLKKKIVEKDPFEKGERKILNFGHSIAHSIEKASGYKISHGEAVGMGLLAESFLSFHLKILKEKDFEKIQKLPIEASYFLEEEKIRFFLQKDKKNKKNSLHMVLLEKIGKVFKKEGQFSHRIEEKALFALLDFLKKKKICLS